MVLERGDWARLDALLAEALDRPAAERRAWLDQACGGDAGLRREMEELLRLAESEDERVRPAGAMTGTIGAELAGDLDAAPDAPGLRPGQRAGRYEVLGLLGTGGMGHVFRARDPTLGREVALKAIAHAFRDDAASLRRFEREARLLATVNHPNIAAIYGFEILDGAPYLVLELVEGESLAERLRRGSLGAREAVGVARQVAEALEEAHHKGIVHRDLKPSNVMLGPGGRVKVVDFGVAKTHEPRAEGPLAPTEVSTASGRIMGTAPYMSPEQLRGESVDGRADVWALGCLLYEMLAGTRAFPGALIPDIVAAVLRDDPDWGALPDDTPESVRRLLRRCLRKDPHQRLQDAGDARLELSEAEAGPAAPATALRPAGPGAGRALRVLPWAIALLAIAAAAVVVVMRVPPSPRAPVARLSLDLPPALTLADDYAAPFALSADGQAIVLLAREGSTSRLYLRRLDDVAARPLPETEGAWQPFLSPDGRWVAFFADRKLKKAPLDGGPALALAEIGGNPRGASWAPDGTIVVAPSQTSGLVRVPENGGRPAPLTTLDVARSEESHRWPDVLPGGRWVLFTVAEPDAGYDEARLEAVSVSTGERRRVLARAAHGRYSPSGHLVFVREGRLHAVAFDLDRLATSGAPQVVVDGVRYDARNGGAHVAVSASGTLVYGPGAPTAGETHLAFVDAEGRDTPVTDTPRTFRHPRLAPDGRRIAVEMGAGAGSDLCVVDGATLSRLTVGLSPHAPVWTPDGRSITVGVEKDGRWRLVNVSAEGAGVAGVLHEGPHRAYPNAWSPDGRRLVLQQYRPETGWDLLVLEVDAAGRPRGAPTPLAAGPFHEARAALSADGRWVAYESDELDGVVDVYVRAFPSGEGRERATTTGARWPRWGRGRELYYWYSFVNRLQVVRGREEAGRFVAVPAEPVWPGGAAAGVERLMVTAGGTGYDVHPGTGRVVVLEAASPLLDPPAARPIVVLGWADDLRARLRPSP